MQTYLRGILTCRMRHLLLLCLCLILLYQVQGQPPVYTVANLHSHNDYEKPFPFQQAYDKGFGSIEADVFLEGEQLLIGHTHDQLTPQRTLQKLYLDPLVALGSKLRPLQLMIDIKTDSSRTLSRLIEVLRQYPPLISNPALHIVISGNRPDVNAYVDYPAYIWFDGDAGMDYPPAALSRIAMMSAPFVRYSQWNGKGIPVAKERDTLSRLIARLHTLHKPVRLWAAPDVVNAWYQLMELGVDYINTDEVEQAPRFMQELPANSYTASHSHELYTPAYTTDGSKQSAKNIILIIGDGTGLAEWYTGYTANKGRLNLFQMKYTGLSKTSSNDAFITDSAPGSTAFSSGEKTNNRFVGVDHTGRPLPLLPEILQARKMRCGVVTSGDITDATPADFYAHRSARDSAGGILDDLATAPLQLLMGAGNSELPAHASLLQQHGYHILHSADSLPAAASERYIVADSKAGLSMQKGRGNWLPQAFDRAVAVLKNNKGFFLALEGAQIDYGGHANNISYIADEVMDLDEVIGKAMQFADTNKETLVIVTADHETGGLSLLNGAYAKGYISGHFATNDHTAIPVPVFAYGPQAQLFTGVYENTAVFQKILQALGMTAH